MEARVIRCIVCADSKEETYRTASTAMISPRAHWKLRDTVPVPTAGVAGHSWLTVSQMRSRHIGGRRGARGKEEKERREERGEKKRRVGVECRVGERVTGEGMWRGTGTGPKPEH